MPSEIETEISAEQVREQVMVRRDPAEMAEYTRTVPILFDQFQEAIGYVTNLLERAQRTKRPGGVWLLGEGGCGKSFVLDHILRRHKPTEGQFERKCPILHLVFSSRPSESDIMLTLLYQLGQDLNLLRNRDNAELERTLVAALAAAQTLLILCDEAQHLWLNIHASRVADRLGARVGDLLKRIYDQSGVAFIFAGTPGLQKILDTDSQSATRWKGLFSLQAFQLGTEFEDVLAAIDEAMPMRTLSGLDKTADKIHLITGGNLRNLKDFLAEAVFLAAKNSSPNISQHLHQACKNTFGSAKPNPFKTYE
jgi:hypothetical protein